MAPKKARLSRKNIEEIADRASTIWWIEHVVYRYREGGRRDELLKRAQIEDEDQKENQSTFEKIIASTKFKASRHYDSGLGCERANEILGFLGANNEPPPYEMSEWIWRAANEIIGINRASRLSTKQWKTLEAWGESAYMRIIHYKMILMNTPDENPIFRKWYDDLVWLKESKK